MSQHTDFLRFLYEHKNGRISDLISMFGEEGVRQMEAMGYIVNAPSSDGDTWRRSKNAEHLANFRYRKSSLVEMIIDWINVNIRKIDFSL